jgi:hypothetical protein
VDHPPEHHCLLLPEGQHARQPVPQERIFIGQAGKVGAIGKRRQVRHQLIPQPQPEDSPPAIGGPQLAHRNVEPVRPQGSPDDGSQMRVVHDALRRS